MECSYNHHCGMCGSQFNNLLAFLRHQLEHCGDDQSHKQSLCLLCLESLPSASSLMHHLIHTHSVAVNAADNIHGHNNSEVETVTESSGAIDSSSFEYNGVVGSQLSNVGGEQSVEESIASSKSFVSCLNLSVGSTLCSRTSTLPVAVLSNGETVSPLICVNVLKPNELNEEGIVNDQSSYVDEHFGVPVTVDDGSTVLNTVNAECFETEADLSQQIRCDSGSEQCNFLFRSKENRKECNTSDLALDDDTAEKESAHINILKVGQQMEGMCSDVNSETDKHLKKENQITSNSLPEELSVSRNISKSSQIKKSMESKDNKNIEQNLDKDSSSQNENDNCSTDFYFLLGTASIKGNSMSYERTEFRCLHCIFSTAWRPSLIKHMKCAHKSILEIHKELEIKKKSPDPLNLDTGEASRKQTDFQVLKMSEYIAGSVKAKLARRRTRRVERQDIPGHYECPVCHRVFSRLRYFRRHQACHHTERPHLCDTCGKSFKTKATLIAHTQSHKSKSYQCPQCSFHSSNGPAIHKHRQLHHNGSVLCDICGTAYIDKSTLKKHRRVHDMSRPFPCTHPGCTWRFKSDVMRKAHVRAHTTQGRFWCPHCGYQFRQKHHMQRHITRQHPNADLAHVPQVLANGLLSEDNLADPESIHQNSIASPATSLHFPVSVAMPITSSMLINSPYEPTVFLKSSPTQESLAASSMNKDTSDLLSTPSSGHLMYAVPDSFSSFMDTEQQIIEVMIGENMHSEENPVPPSATSDGETLPTEDASVDNQASSLDSSVALTIPRSSADSQTKYSIEYLQAHNKELVRLLQQPRQSIAQDMRQESQSLRLVSAESANDSGTLQSEEVIVSCPQPIYFISLDSRGSLHETLQGQDANQLNQHQGTMLVTDTKL